MVTRGVQWGDTQRQKRKNAENSLRITPYVRLTLWKTQNGSKINRLYRNEGEPCPLDTVYGSTKAQEPKKE